MGRGRLTASGSDRGDGPAQLRPHRRTDPVVGLALSRRDAEAQWFLDNVIVVARVEVDADEIVIRSRDRDLRFAR
jgi:hypothetical protein